MLLQPLLGLLAFTALAWASGGSGRRLDLRVVIVGLVLQIGLAWALLRVAIFRQVFLLLNGMVASLGKATEAGTAFVFGFLGGAPLPYAEIDSGSSFVLAFRALPLVLVVSALSALLFYWRVLPVVVRGFAWALEQTMGVGGAVGVSAAANVFVGMVEAPLLVRPYLGRLTRSELFVVMTCGMATIAGTVMVLYASILAPVIPGAMGHILTASIVSAPAAVMIAKLMVPETEPPTPGDVALAQEDRNTIDAITRGTLQGVTLLLNIVAMLIVLVALVHLANQILGLLPAAGGAPITLQRLLGVAMAPVTWLMGVPWSEAPAAGALMGTKTILNELLAYLQLARLPEGTLSPESRLIMTYAMCGFANFGSLGIMLGGLASMVPERRGELVSLGPRSLVSGTLATCMTGAVVGLVQRW